jgi:tetratricopeptide (TPR) repeat protein
MEQVRFHEFRSHALLTRLRLYRRLPSFYKAEQEGLLIEHYDQSEKSSSRRIGYAPEYPWRSKDPAADHVFALVSKLHDDVAPEGHAQLLGLAVEFLRQPGVGELPAEERLKAFVDAHRGQLKKPEASRPPAPPPPKRTDTVDVWKLLNEGKYDEATAIAQAMEPSPHQQRILQQVELQRLFREAVGHRQARKHPLAATAYEKIIALAPEDAEGHRGLAMTLWELNRRQEAGAAYAKYCALKGLPPPEPNAMPR